MAKEQDEAATEAKAKAAAEKAKKDAEAAKAKEAKQAQIVGIRAMRAEAHPEDATKARYTHKQVADHFGVTPGFVSSVARNRIYTDPNYTPVFDGNRDLGPRQPKPSAVPGEQAPAEVQAISTGEERADPASAE